MAASRLCSIQGCSKPAFFASMCQSHYRRLRLYGDPLGGERFAQTGTCAIGDCNRAAKTKGMCRMHYRRNLRYGDPLFRKIQRGEPMKWLHEHANYSGGDCLDWPLWRNLAGYGYVTVGRKNIAAATIMCEIVNGPKPTPAHESAHSCGRGHLGCVHPKHLRWATRAENMADKLLHGTAPRGENHPQTNLSVDDIRKIRSLAGTHSQSRIGEMFGISQQAVSKIINRNSWWYVD